MPVERANRLSDPILLVVSVDQGDEQSASGTAVLHDRAREPCRSRALTWPFWKLEEHARASRSGHASSPDASGSNGYSRTVRPASTTGRGGPRRWPQWGLGLHRVRDDDLWRCRNPEAARGGGPRRAAGETGLRVPPRAGPYEVEPWRARHALAEGVAVVRVLAVLRTELGRAEPRAPTCTAWPRSTCSGAPRPSWPSPSRRRTCRRRSDHSGRCRRTRRTSCRRAWPRSSHRPACAACRAGADPVLVLGSRPLGDALAEGVPAVALHRAVRLAEELQAQLGAEARHARAAFSRSCPSGRRRAPPRDDQGREDRDDQDVLHCWGASRGGEWSSQEVPRM